MSSAFFGLNKMNVFEGLIEIITTKSYILTVLEGLKLTLLITVCALIIGLVLGMILAVVKIMAINIKGMKFPAKICDIYIAVIRGTPVALQLFLMAFAIFAIRGFPLELTAILTFGLNSAAYVAENIRAGILSIDKGQTEAGRALGLGYGVTMSRIVVPQAIKNIIPTIGNEIIALLKETSIVSMVGLIDLTFAAKIIGAGQNMASYIVPMLFVAIFYLVLVYLITLVINYIERRLRASDKR